MPEEHHLTARNLLEQMNRQFNECNALYHELAVHYGVSDTVFWLLYSLYNSSEPQTQNRLCMEWNLPKQTISRGFDGQARTVGTGTRAGPLQRQTAAPDASRAGTGNQNCQTRVQRRIGGTGTAGHGGG